MVSKLLLVALATAVAARFSGSLQVRINADGSCIDDDITVQDTALPGLHCGGHLDCKSNGNEIATIHHRCATNGGADDSDVFVYAHDTLKFCRKGFCSCMTTQYQETVNEGGGRKSVYFNFDDDHAWNC